MTYLNNKYADAQIESADILELKSVDDVQLAEIYFIQKYKPKLNLLNNSKYAFAINSSFTINQPELDSMEWVNFECKHDDIGYFIYIFINKDNKPIYIGKTKQKISIRMNGHKHLPSECYNSVDKIYFGEVETESDMAIYETYYINRYKPRYNTMLKFNDKVSIKLPDLNFKLLA